MRRNISDRIRDVLILLALCAFTAASGTRESRAAIASFDALGRLTNPEEIFRYRNPPPKGKVRGKKGALPPIPEIDAYDLHGFPLLMRAVSANNKAEVARLLQRKANPNVRNVYGRTPLEAAADRGNLEIAALLVEHGAKAGLGYPLHYAGEAETNSAAMQAFLQKHGARDRNAPPQQHRSRIRKPEEGVLLARLLEEEEKSGVPQSSIPAAVLMGRSQEDIAALIKRGSNVNEVHPVFGTALEQALRQPHGGGLVAFLLQSGADPNLSSHPSHGASTHGSTLGEAIDTGNEVLVRRLLDAGAKFKDPKEKNPEKTLFHKAVSKGMLEAVRLMLAKGADPNEYVRDSKGRKTTPPIFLTDSVDMLRLLIEAGADPNARNQKGENALAALVWSKQNIPDAMVLLENGVSATHSSVGKAHGQSLIHWAVLANSRELFQAARKAGVSVTDRDEKKCTPLLLAVQEGKTWFVSALLEAGAPVNGSATYPGQRYADYERTYAATDDLLAQALDRGYPEIARILIKAGVNLNTKSNTYNQGTALHLAVEAKHREMVAALLDSGAKTEIRDRNGQTPLHLAARGGLASSVEALMKAGADPKAEDADGETPLDFARQREADPQIIRLLEKR